MVRWFESEIRHNAGKRAEFFTALENASRPMGAVGAPTDSSELRSLSSVLHYAESVIANYDRNSDGKLNSSELWASYPIIEPFIRKLAGADSSDSINRAIFSYLVVFGEPPASGWIGSGKLLTWSAARHVWWESADRLDVLRVMGGFGIAGRRASVKSADDFFTEQIEPKRNEFVQKLEAGDEATVLAIANAFQCVDTAEVTQTLREQLKVKAAELLLPKATATEFRSRLRQLIESDRRLEFGCLAF
jgi:hypothetical protein